MQCVKYLHQRLASFFFFTNYKSQIVLGACSIIYHAILCRVFHSLIIFLKDLLLQLGKTVLSVIVCVDLLVSSATTFRIVS